MKNESTGLADREVSSISGPTARIDRNVQWQVLHILQPPAVDIQGGFGVLPRARRHSRGREQSRIAGIHLVGAVEATQVSSNRFSLQEHTEYNDCDINRDLRSAPIRRINFQENNKSLFFFLT